MPVVGAIIGAVLSAAGAVITAVAVTLGAIISTVMTGLSLVIEPIIGGITHVLGEFTGFVLEPMTRFIKDITGPLGGALGELKDAILFPVKDILGPLGEGLKTIKGAITDATAPVLGPIYDTMETIHTFVHGTQREIIEGLEPIRDLASLVRDFSHFKIVTQVLSGTEDLFQLVELVADEAGIETAGAIATMWRDTVDVALSLSSTIDDHVDLVRGEIDTLGERLTQEQETALAQVRQRIDTTVANVEGIMRGEIRGIEGRVLLAERKMEEVPWFREMMIRSFT